jgi:glycosyltransferase involved in cell wall biosynthesis
VVQGTVSPGFGGLEMVVIEFHEWLLSKNIDAHVIAIEGSPLEQNLRQRGHHNSVISVPANNAKAIAEERKKFDSPQTAMLFHRQQGLKQLRFRQYKSKISLLSHTFYSVKKKDFWHRLIFKKVDQWVVLTELHKLNLLETAPVAQERIQVIPNGVDLKKFTPQFKDIPSRDGIINLGVIARLDPQKGQDIAIRALAELKARGDRRWRLHFFGDETPNEASIRPFLHKLARELGVEEQVVYRGFQKDLHHVIGEMDVVWMPSYKETFGRCILEGMASGIPVIASNDGGVPDIIQNGHNGILFETKNFKELADKTTHLLESPSLFRSIQIKAREDVEQFYDQDVIWSRLLKTISP